MIFSIILIYSDGFLKSNPDYGCKENAGLSRCGATFGRKSKRTKILMFPCELTYCVRKKDSSNDQLSIHIHFPVDLGESTLKLWEDLHK